MQLHLNAIDYRYPEAADPVLRGVSATFPSGWTGIVGDNGAGKSTLARIACGLIGPDAGAAAPKLRAAYCEQETISPPGNLEDFACSYDSSAIKLRATLGVEEDWPWRYDGLSGGQQKRLQIACALWAEPDLLVVDEPTNHLDGPTRRAVAGALSRFKGIGLLISHDRALLDQLCGQCLFLAEGQAVMRPGAYSQGESQAELEDRSASRAREKARREQRRIAAEAAMRRETASRAASRRSARNVAEHDSDAREKIRLAVYSGQDGKAGKLSARMDARLERASEVLANAHVRKRYEGNVWFDVAASRKPVLVQMDACRIALGDGKTLEVPGLWIARDARIGLVGENGSGKSTLVRALAERLGRTCPVLYIPQEPSFDERAAALARLRELPDAQRGRVLAVVAQLNSHPQRILEGGRISPGELRKLMLALGILDRPSALVMDEPTNHMDVGSIEALERMLGGFPGALVLVSHDKALVGSVAAEIWEIERVAERTFALRKDARAGIAR